MKRDVFSGLFGENNIKSVHMLGINGISMGGLAEVLMSFGYKVSGSDLVLSDRTKKLMESGALICHGNTGENLYAGGRPDLLVYTAAAGDDNPERVEAESRGIPCIERSDLLGGLMAAYETSVGVAGTHGKTTTTSMLASIFLAAGLDPTINNGGEYSLIDGTTRIGEGELFLCEACEYVDSFLKLHPTFGVITNIEYDHSDYFSGEERVVASFINYAEQVSGALILNCDDKNVRKVIAALGTCPSPKGSRRRTVLFGVESEDAGVRAIGISFDSSHNASFILSAPEYITGNGNAGVTLKVPGIFNIYNALAAAAAAFCVGVPAESIVMGLERFSGAKKRFEHLGNVSGVEVIDDYAHHPTAVRLALGAAREYTGCGSVHCVFHPHTYSRTKEFLTEFADAFTLADRVHVMDIFPAREPDPGDINSEMLVYEINRRGGRAVYAPGPYDLLARRAMEDTRPGDTLITMGAGLAVNVAHLVLTFESGNNIMT